MCITLLFKGHFRSKNWKKVKFWSEMMKIANDSQITIKCISKHCIFHTDFKYVHKIAGQDHLRSKNWTKVKLWSKMMKITNDNQMAIKCISKDWLSEICA